MPYVLKVEKIIIHEGNVKINQYVGIDEEGELSIYTDDINKAAKFETLEDAKHETKNSVYAKETPFLID